jgi:hypothetical protein
MDPLTLKVLATLVQVHGTSATLVSTNKGIDDLLGPVREQLQDQTKVAAGKGSGDIFNCTLPHCKDIYSKAYTKTYYKYTGIAPAKSGTSNSAPTTNKKHK